MHRHQRKSRLNTSALQQILELVLKVGEFGVMLTKFCNSIYLFLTNKVLITGFVVVGVFIIECEKITPWMVLFVISLPKSNISYFKLLKLTQSSWNWKSERFWSFMLQRWQCLLLNLSPSQKLLCRLQQFLHQLIILIPWRISKYHHRWLEYLKPVLSIT